MTIDVVMEKIDHRKDATSPTDVALTRIAVAALDLMHGWRTDRLTVSAVKSCLAALALDVEHALR